MSQYLSFCLKRKDTSELKIELGYWCTTPARTLSSEGIFPYTEDTTLVTPDRYKEYMDGLDYYIKSTEDSIHREQELNYRELFQNSKSKEAAEFAYDRMIESESFIKEMDEEIDLYKDIRKTIQTYWAIAQENPQYDLYYINC